MLIGHIYSKMSINIDSRLHNSQFKVILAQHSPSYPSGHEEEFFVSKKLIHKDFNHNNYHNDIAVIKLNRRVQFSRHIRPVCVPTVGNGKSSIRIRDRKKNNTYCEYDFSNSPKYLSLDNKFENVEAKVIGWGYTREDGNGSSPDILHQVDLPIMKNEDCIKESKYSKGDLKHISILPSMICAKSHPGEGKDACNVMIFN